MHYNIFDGEAALRYATKEVHADVGLQDGHEPRGAAQVYTEVYGSDPLVKG
jgi:hypothetical protein